MTIYSPLTSLPHKVKIWAEDQLRLRPSKGDATGQEIRGRIERLTSWESNRICWKTIDLMETRFPSFSALEVAYRAVAAPSNWNTVSKARQSDMATKLAQISGAAEKLASLLSANRNEIRCWVGADIETAALLRRAAANGSEPLVAALYEIDVETALRNSNSLSIDADLDQYFPRLHEFIGQLASSLHMAAETEELLLRPTKPGDTNASRTYTIRVLSHYFRTTTKKPAHSVVAALVSSVLDDEDITDNLVSKLTRDLA